MPPGAASASERGATGGAGGGVPCAMVNWPGSMLVGCWDARRACQAWRRGEGLPLRLSGHAVPPCPWARALPCHGRRRGGGPRCHRHPSSQATLRSRGWLGLRLREQPRGKLVKRLILRRSCAPVGRISAPPSRCCLLVGLIWAMSTKVSLKSEVRRLDGILCKQNVGVQGGDSTPPMTLCQMPEPSVSPSVVKKDGKRLLRCSSSGARRDFSPLCLLRCHSVTCHACAGGQGP